MVQPTIFCEPIVNQTKKLKNFFCYFDNKLYSVFLR